MPPHQPDLLAFLDEQRAVLRSAFDSVPRALRTAAPRPGRWSAAAVVEHLAIVESRIGPALASQLLDPLPGDAAKKVAGPPLDPGRVADRSTKIVTREGFVPTGLDPDAAWGALDRAGEVIRAAIRTADPSALERVGMTHPVFGALTIRDWVVFVGAHEARHAAQIVEDYALT